MESGPTSPDRSPGDRIPRGAIVVVVIGLLATLAAALLTDTGSGTGSFAHLEFVMKRKMPDSKALAVPGSENAKMQLVGAGLQATGTNVAGYELLRAAAVLKVDEGAPVGGGRIRCTTHAPRAETEIAHSHGELRTTYPRSSTGLYNQSVEETILVKFASHSNEYAVLEPENLPLHWASIEGVKLDWPTFEEGTENLDYTLPEGKLQKPLELPFYTVWKTRKAPAAEISCKLTVAAGSATVKTAGSMGLSPPIDEEAEEVAQEEREETEEGEEPAEEGEESEGE
jgi:hypothetical protein